MVESVLVNVLDRAVWILGFQVLDDVWFQVRSQPLRPSVAHGNVTSLRRKPFNQKGLATLLQQCYQSTQYIPVYRVDYLSFQGHRPGVIACVNA